MNISLHAQTSSRGSGGKSSPGNQSTGPSNIIRPPLKPLPPKVDPEAKKQVIEKEPELSFRPIFFQPGILQLRGEGFVGVDHLFNVPGNIPVVIEIEKPANLTLSITQEKLQALVEATFEKEGISPTVKPTAGPALPFFQLLIMVLPAGEGYSAFCSGRLFEKVDLERVALPQGVYFQAITWEFQNLVFASKSDYEAELDKAIAEIIQQFLSRYKYYKNISR